MEPSFSLFNNRVIYLDFLFNGSTCQRLKVSRHIISASTHFYMKFGVYVFSLMALISIHQSFHFKISHLISILSISTVFVFGELFYHHYYFTFQHFSNGKTRFCFWTLLQIQVLNKNLTNNPGEDKPSLQYELKYY